MDNRGDAETNRRVRSKMEEEEVRRSDEELKVAASGVRRPMNAFLIFCKRHRRLVREKNPHLDNRSVTRNLGELWANLPPEEKATYTSVANEYKEAFMKANPDYKWFNPDKTGGVSREKPTTRPTNSLTSYIGQVPHTDDSSETPSHLENTPCTEDFLAASKSPGKFSGSAGYGGVSMLLMASHQTLPSVGGQVNYSPGVTSVSAIAPPSVNISNNSSAPPTVTLSAIPAAITHPYIVSTHSTANNTALQPLQTVAPQTFIQQPVTIATTGHLSSFGAHSNPPFTNISPVYSKNGALPLPKTLPQSAPSVSTLVSPHISPVVMTVPETQRMWNPLEKTSPMQNVPKTTPQKEEKSLTTLFDLAQMCFSEAEKQVTAKLTPQPLPPVTGSPAHVYTNLLNTAPPAHLVVPPWTSKYPDLDPGRGITKPTTEDKPPECSVAVDFSLKKKPDDTTQKVATSTQVDSPSYGNNKDGNTSYPSPLNYHSEALAKLKSLGVEKSFVAPPKDAVRTPIMTKAEFGVGKLFMEHVIESMYSSEFSQTKICSEKIVKTSIEKTSKSNSDKLAAASAITSLSRTMPKPVTERSRDLSLDARSRVELKAADLKPDRDAKPALTFGEIQETLIRKAVENSLDLGISRSSTTDKSTSWFKNEDKENRQCHVRTLVTDAVKETPGACGRSYDLAKNFNPADEPKSSLDDSKPSMHDTKSLCDLKPSTGGVKSSIGDVKPPADDSKPSGGNLMPNLSDSKPSLGGLKPSPGDLKSSFSDLKPAGAGNDIKPNGNVKPPLRFGSSCCPTVVKMEDDEKKEEICHDNGSQPTSHFTSVKDINNRKLMEEGDVRWEGKSASQSNRSLPPGCSPVNELPVKSDLHPTLEGDSSHQAAQSAHQPDDTHSSNDEMGEGSSAQVKDVSVRKSKRSNRGRRYQELIDQGYLQPAREKTPAIRKSFSSEISDAEAAGNETSSPVNGRKRTFSETDAAAAGSNDDLSEKRYKTGDFDLEAHIASLPVCHIDEVGRKNVTKIKGHTKMRHNSENSTLQSAGGPGSNPGLVNVAELRQMIRPACPDGTMPVSGSKRRKARKSAITHLIVAPATEVEKVAANNNNNNNTISSTSDITSPLKSQPEVSAHVTMAIRPASDATVPNNNSFEKTKPTGVVVSCP